MVSTVIGPLGGTVTGPDGVQVVIPAGALSKSTTIGIAKSSMGTPALPTGYPSMGTVYEFTPHDIVFALPVTIRMPVPNGAPGNSVVMASSGEDWGQMDAYNNNGMAEFERNSFSWGFLPEVYCSFNRNDPNLDPSGCVWRSGYASANATPAAALTRNVVMLNAQPTLSPVPSAGSYTLNQAATVRLKLVYKAGEDCINNTVTISRYEMNATGPGTFGPRQTLFKAAVSMTPSGGNAPFRSASGITTFDVAFTSADSGKKYWFGLGHTCNKPGAPAIPKGDGLVIDVANLAPPAVTYTVGGTVSGLTGTGLVLQNNGMQNLPVGADGTFTFATALAAGDPYSVTVLTQPSGQTCTVTNGAGTVQGNVANVAVTCVAATGLVYPVGGYASYLNKGPVVLQMVYPAGTETITVNADNFFTFPTKILSGSPYSVTVVTAPAGQSCKVLNGSGTSSATNRRIDVTCADNGLALVANSSDSTLSAYSTNGTTGALTSLGTAAAAPSPHAIAIEPCSRYAYINGSPSNTIIQYAFATAPAQNSISSYAVSASKGTATQVANSGIYSPNPRGVAASCGWVYAVNYTANTVSTFSVDGTTGLLAASGTPVATGLNPYAIMVHPTGNWVYVANEISNSVSVYTVGAGTGVLTPVAGTLANAVVAPHGLVLDRSYNFLHVTSTTGNVVVTLGIDRATGTVTGVAFTTPTGTRPEGIAVHPNGQFLYTANAGSNDISIFSIDPATGALTAVGAPVSAGGNQPTGLALGLGGAVLYVTNMGDNTTSVFSVDALTGALTTLGVAVNTGAGPGGIVVTP